ncbi:hypothetical protein NVP1244A_117 [Vibrio phage 1.244.A._10N.261.54.C3]|nr:hypothetical protein NVP1244A_117 [Vibrio phage 1.244.A._10N.261.54.C3]AUR98745.1 hypothetical protein NVP1255O_117 [Vibrio phage 1.255.O._10N.286.45.F1]
MNLLKKFARWVLSDEEYEAPQAVMSNVVVTSGSISSIGKPISQPILVHCDVRGVIIDVVANPDKPTYIGVRFERCTIKADNFKAFAECYFENCDIITETVNDPKEHKCYLREPNCTVRI